MMATVVNRSSEWNREILSVPGKAGLPVIVIAAQQTLGAEKGRVV